MPFQNLYSKYSVIKAQLRQVVSADTAGVNNSNPNIPAVNELRKNSRLYRRDEVLWKNSNHFANRVEI